MSQKRSHLAVFSDEEANPETELRPPKEKIQRQRRPYRQTNNERLERLERMLEQFMANQTNTVAYTTPQQQLESGASTSQARLPATGTSLKPNSSRQPALKEINQPINSSTSCLDNESTSNLVMPANRGDIICMSAPPSAQTPSTTYLTSTTSPSNDNNFRFLSKPENVPKFNGDTNSTPVHIWLHRLEALAKIYGWDERTLIYHMTASLTGNALLWFDHLRDIDMPWEEWKKRLTDYFPAGRGLAAKLHDFVVVNKRKEEKVLDFYYKKLAQGKSCELSDHLICDVIIYTLGDPLLKAGARGAGCRDTRSLLNYLTDAAIDSSQTKSFENSGDKDFNRQTKCFSCGRRGHVSADCRSAIRCGTCDKLGHRTENCRFGKKCSHCNKIGHLKEECYSFKNNNALNVNQNFKPDETRDRKLKLFNIRPIDEGDRKYHKTAIANNSKVSAYIDLGSACNTITLSAARKIGLLYNDQTKTSIKGYGGQIIKPEGESIIKLNIDGVCADTSVLVVRDDLQETEMIVGRAFTELPNICINKTSQSLTFSKCDEININKELPFAIENEIPKLSKIELKLPLDTSLVQGLNRIIVFTEEDTDGTDTLIHISYSEHRSPYKEIDIPEQTINLCGNIGCMDVFSLQSQTLTLFSTRCVTRAQIINTLESDIDTDVKGEDRVHLEQILEQFDHVFDDKARVGECDVEMVIELTTEIPTYSRPYRMSQKEQEIVRGIVQDLLDKDIIEPSNSPYASPIILVPKKSGEYRMCVDYRQLNKVTKKDRYPLPIIQDQLDRLSANRVFTKLDLAAGYHQIKMHVNSKKYTAFVTPFGQFQYKRMPFGLANAPSVFQRAINLMLGNLRFQFATAYIDDILIFSKSIPDSFSHLKKILHIIDKSGLVLRREKCSFLKTKVDYLGHNISDGEIRPSPEKVKALTKFKQPGDVHELRRFIGLASYFRKFVRSFANKIRPLSVLLKKDCQWQWGDEQQKSFEDIKTVLSSEPVLAIYNPELETQLHTDASSYGVGGILLQKQLDGNLKPVAYFSKQTTSTEQKYHSYELEAMAVVLSINKFRVYLLGRSFVVLTDCQALSTTWAKKDMLPRIGRWWLELQNYDFTVQYRPGERMKHADALSRCALPLQHITEENWVTVVQTGDPKIQNIITNIKDPGFSKIFTLKDGILYKLVNDIPKIVIPKSMRWRITKTYHDDNGHMGENKVIELIQRQYWFEKLRRFVTKYVKGCISCQFVKKPTGRQRGYLNTIEKGNTPWSTWHLDHLGPFCASTNGNSYLLVIIDAFSKFVWLQPVPNTSTEHVVTTISFLFRVFGMPTRIISDRGKAFTSHDFERFCKEKQIRHILNAVACPRANGQVERSNRTILQSLMAYTGENNSDWEQFIPQVERGINTTYNSTTKKCPYELLYGFKPRFEIDLPNSAQIIPDITELRAQAQQNIVNSAAKAKERYDKNRIDSIKYQIGDLVQVQRRIIKKGLTSGKLVDKYAGPYKVVKVYDNDRYRVASLNKRGRKYNNVIAADKMKHFVVQSFSSDDEE